MNSGYGQLGFRGQTQTAHRVAWQISRGREIPEGHVVGHVCHDEALALGECVAGALCSHKLCVRPEHLWLMTLGQNMRAGGAGQGAMVGYTGERALRRMANALDVSVEALVAFAGSEAHARRAAYAADPSKPEPGSRRQVSREPRVNKQEVGSNYAIHRGAALALGLRITDYYRIHGHSTLTALRIIAEHGGGSPRN